jgi:carbon-monoxide dehydrogenase large subunit
MSTTRILHVNGRERSVEVDPVTGGLSFHRYVMVQDAGRILNPLIAGGQLQGAGAQGIGRVVHEHVVYDDHGQPLATTFMDYLLPAALDVPEFEIEYIETRTPSASR